MTADRMHPADLETLADLVADRLADRLSGMPDLRSTPKLVDAAAIAELTGLSRDAVYTRAVELGAVRIGSGPRPRLRFDAERVMELLAASPMPSQPESARPTRRRRPRSTTSVVELLPIRGPEA